MSAPIFSVIVPTYNRPHQVRACLEKLASLDYDKKALEVILVDDGGACDLKSVVAPFLDRLIVKLERQPNHGPAGARNRGRLPLSATSSRLQMTIANRSAAGCGRSKHSFCVIPATPLAAAL